MADVKTGPYEIRLRFNCEIGEPFDQVRGTDLSSRSYLVDEGGIITGKIDSGTGDHPKLFPAIDLPDYLGARFVAFDAQLDNLKGSNAALTEALAASKAETANALAKLELASKSFEESQRQLAEANAKIAELGKAAA